MNKNLQYLKRTIPDARNQLLKWKIPDLSGDKGFMNIINKERVENENYIVIDYKLDETIRRSNVKDVAKSFESDDIKMAECYISSYSETGTVSDRIYYSFEDLEEIKDYPNPSISMTLTYVDRISGEYRFTLKTETNNKKIRYLIDKAKL